MHKQDISILSVSSWDGNFSGTNKVFRFNTPIDTDAFN